MTKKYILCCQVLFYCFTGIAQQLNKLPLMQSPTTASLGIYGKIEVSPFTGIADVGVDVFSVNEGDISLNCNLKYYTGGVKPAQHPGWVGSNWSLNVGGIVTRKVNGGVDEVAAYFNNAADPNFTSWSYLYNYQLVSDPNWYTSLFISQNYRNELSNFIQTPYDKVNLSPDEFIFNLPGGLSGSFFLNHLGNWVVKTKAAADIKVLVEVNNQPFSLQHINTTEGETYSANIKRLIYKIIITDNNGFEYTFGNATDAIEFSRGPLPNPSSPNNENIVANTWYLTKIVSPLANIVNLSYDRKENNYVKSMFYSKWRKADYFMPFSSGYNRNDGTVGYFGSIISPCYLKNISSKSFSIDFHKSVSNELSYYYGTNVTVPFKNLSFNYPDIEISDIVDPLPLLINSLSKYYKLDNIVINDYTGNQVKKFAFNYNNNSNERLFLNNFRVVSLSGLEDQIYSFTYNTSVQLPEYNKMLTDKWGFFNNKQYPLVVNSTMTAAQLLPYFDMDNTYAQAGTLIKINYPTSGYSTFEYEPNDYSSVIIKNGNSIALQSQTGIGGGIRINKIKHFDNNGSQYITQYIYKNSVTNLSSGILAGNKRISYQTQIGNPSLVNIQSLGFDERESLDYTDGKDIVYSEVKKIFPDGSYQIYNYSNSDNNTYIDEVPLNIYTNAFVKENNPATNTFISTWNSSAANTFISHCSRDLERGMLNKQRDYSAGNVLLHIMENQYNDDPMKFNQFVRSLDFYQENESGSYGFARERYYNAVKIYNYFPYLKKTIETNYDQNGTNPLVTSTDYIYDNYKNLKSQLTVNSKNETILTSFNYANDNIVGLSVTSLAAKDAMVTNHNYSTILEKITTKNGTLLSTNRSNYKLWSGTNLANYVAPQSEEQSFYNNSLEVKANYNNYDGFGNILEAQKANDVATFYLWDYKNQYPVAKINNGALADIAYSSFETENKGGWEYYDVAVLNANAATGKKIYELASGNRNIKRITSNTKTYILSLWANSVGVLINGTASTRQGRTLNGYTYYEWEVLGTSLITISSNASIFIDELRLYPKGCLMQTYTYNPLIGMTSQCDANNRIQFYEYDNLNRLIFVKDQDKNIIKKICYNYAGQPENCTVTVPVYYYNTSQSAPFTKTCPVSQQSSSVTFTVPANAFSSIVSVIDANNTAIAFMNANGSAYANQYATCTAIPCTGIDKKIINGVCQTGILGEISTVRSGTNCITKWGYFFSDGTYVYSYSTTTPTQGGGCI